ncbi:6-carboxytetrahydropterin synthase QueD [bacterium Unc6]|nr:6-carboxytetrahydropterin synthase QueD [bacterium Unc6]
MPFQICIYETFSGAHNLREYQGECEKLHGHNWKVEVSVTGILNRLGMVIDFTVLRDSLKSILSKIDHTYLNEIPYFKKNNPTSENITKYIAQELKKDKDLKKIKIISIKVWEKDTAAATYIL